jgi:hypothetical protein
MTMNDPILTELWQIKDGMAKACGYDMRTFFERLKAAQRAHPDRIVNLQTRKSAPVQYVTQVAETSDPYLG